MPPDPSLQTGPSAGNGGSRSAGEGSYLLTSGSHHSPSPYYHRGPGDWRLLNVIELGKTKKRLKEVQAARVARVSAVRGGLGFVDIGGVIVERLETKQRLIEALGEDLLAQKNQHV